MISVSTQVIESCPFNVASSLFYQKRNKLNDDRAGRFSKIDEDEIIQEVLKENIYVIAKTPMAKTITQRTLAGYNNWATNILYVEEINQKLKSNMEQTIKEIQKGLNAMKFDVVIGNPPYQEQTIGNSTQALPIYNKFMDLSYQIADKAILITPARFLFNAGATGKAWNEKMLHDEHLKVIYFNQNSSDVFPNTDIKGGIAITYRDVSQNFGSIGVFTSFPELNSILKKVEIKNERSFSSIIYGQNTYQFSEKFHLDNPEAKDKMSKGHEKDIITNAFDTLDFVFYD